MAGGLTYKIGLGSDYYATLDAFRKLPAQATKEMRDESVTVGTVLEHREKAAGQMAGRQAPAASSSTRVLRDRFVKVRVGGERVVLPGARAGDVLFGSEFGGGKRYTRQHTPVFGRTPKRSFMKHTTRQFGPHTGGEGRWWMPTIRRTEPEIRRRYLDAVERIIQKWAGR